MGRAYEKRFVRKYYTILLEVCLSEVMASVVGN